MNRLLNAIGTWFPSAAWHAGRPFRAARLALRAMNYEPQHVDPWGADAESIYDREPDTLDRIELHHDEPGFRLGAVQVYQAPRTDLVRRLYVRLAVIAEQNDQARNDDGLLLDPRWLHAHWWWYAQERRREADEYHVRMLAERREFRRLAGLSPLEAVAA